MTLPSRQIRAVFDDETITVYQAYSPAIAEPALAAQTFVPPFKRERMTWIKPSFLWMMYRCGWAAKPGQERVLAIRLRREGFARALAHSCGSRPGRGATAETWKARLAASPVRVQWDPERGLRLERLEHRSIQIGLSGEAVRLYTSRWIEGIEDATGLARRIGTAVAAGRDDEASELLPVERPFPLDAATADRIGASDRQAGR